jgi:hypothetical protein
MKKMERQRRKTKIYKHIHEGTHNCYMNMDKKRRRENMVRGRAMCGPACH